MKRILARWRPVLECRAIISFATGGPVTKVGVCHRWRWHRGSCDKVPAEGRVGNHGEGRCANGQPVDGSIPAPKTVDPPQAAHIDGLGGTDGEG